MHGAEDPYDVVMPPLRVWKVGRESRPELIYNFNPAPHIIKELEEVNDEDDTNSWEDVDDSDASSDSGSGYESDKVSEGET